MSRVRRAENVTVPIFAALSLGLLLAISAPASAAWPDGIWTSLGQTFGKPGARGDTAENLAAFLKSLPQPQPDAVVLAAHAGAEGNWTFVSRNGETFTVGTPDEMKRVVATLAPDASPKSVLTIHLSAATVFDRAELLKELPAGAALAVVVEGKSLPLMRTRDGGTDKLRALPRPHLHLEIGDRALFAEALAQLDQPLDKTLIRVLSLEPGGPETLARAPKPDPETGRPPGDVIDPFRLPAALASLTGQTAVISGRIDGEYLVFRPSSGKETTILAGDVVKAAERASVDLVLVQSSTPHQPGARNWLWQRFEIDGLTKAMDHATLGDFLATLGGSREPALVVAADKGAYRIALTVNPPRANSGGLGGILQEMTAGITGSIAPTTVEMHLTRLDRRRELASRLVPLIPSQWQAAYAIAVLLGLLRFRVARAWWRRLWPRESRDDYPGKAGYVAARVVRTATFALLFLPIAGLPAVVSSVISFLRRTKIAPERPAEG